MPSSPGPSWAGPPGTSPPRRPRGLRWMHVALAAVVAVALVAAVIVVAGRSSGDETASYEARRPGGDPPRTQPPTTAPPRQTETLPPASMQPPVEITVPPTTAGGDVDEVGGTVTIGMEYDGECLDWIDVCAGTAWSFWAVGVQTMPGAFDAVHQGEDWVLTPSILLTGEPEMVTEPQQVVTYHISPDAVWNDGQPITSSDFRYTWEQVAFGDDIYDPTGYTDIESVDDSDPSTAVVTFARPYAAWRELFGGVYGILPAHLLAGTDRHEAMADGYAFSGGPWVLESWKPGIRLSLVPNPMYWGTVPTLDRVEFRVAPDPSAAFAGYRAGELDVLYPTPQTDVFAEIAAGVPGTLQANPRSNAVEALWLNNAAFPFDSVAVRRAFAYSVDRSVITTTLFGPVGITTPWETLSAPVSSAFADTAAFSGYVRDLAKVDELMSGDGWVRNGAGFWEKAGRVASIAITTTTGNDRRATVQELIRVQASEAGFDVTLENRSAAELFGERLPAGEFQAAIYAQVNSGTDPGLCWIMCASAIPDSAGYGNNWTRTDLAAAEPALQAAQVTLDPAARAAANQEAERALAADVASLPLYSLPNLLLTSDRLTGPITDNAVYGPFVAMNEWALAG